MKKFELIVRNLTVAQIAALFAFLKVNKELVSSEEVSANLIVGSGRSLSALASLQITNPPILNKCGKMSARAGSLWTYNDTFGNRDEVTKLVKEIIEKYKSAGVINEKNPSL